MAVLDDAGVAGVPDHVSKWAGALSSVLAIIATVAGAVAALSGGTERMVREQPGFTFGAIAGLAAGILVLAAALILVPGAAPKSAALRTRLLGLSLPFFLAAVIFGALAASGAATAQEEPSVKAELSIGDSPAIAGELTASGLTAEDRFNLVVEGFPMEGNRIILFRTAQGPARDGSLAFPFSVPLRSHDLHQVQVTAWRVGDPQPNCNLVETNESRRAACLLVQVPSARYGPPQVEVTRSDDKSTVSGTVSAATSPNRVLILRVFVDGAEAPVYEATFVSDGNGVLAAKFGPVDVGASSIVCIHAAPLDYDPGGCPPTEAEPQVVAWVSLGAPPTPAPSPSPTPAPTAAPGG